MDSIYEGVQGGGILEDTGEEGLLGLGSGESLYGESSFSLGKLKGPGAGRDDGDGLYLQPMSRAL